MRRAGGRLRPLPPGAGLTFHYAALPAGGAKPVLQMQARGFFGALRIACAECLQDFVVLLDRAFQIGARIDGAAEPANNSI